MKKFIYCETPFQVIVALCIKEQFCKKEDIVDIFIADTFSGYDKIATNLRKANIFNKVIEVKVKDIVYAKKIYQFILRLFYIFFPKVLIKRRITKDFDVYDEMYCWNYYLVTASIRSYYAFRKHRLKVFMFEEAYISYLPIDEVIPVRGFLKLLEIRNRLCGISYAIRKNIDGLLLFEPENIIYKPSCKIYKINRDIFNKKEFKKTIDDIFNVGDALKKYDKKYIIFEEAMFANDPEIDDERIIDKIIDIVGKDNVIIKLHPRTSEDRFSKKGIKTLGSDGIPWEALTCVGDFSDKVFITISSSSITTYKTIFGNKIKAYMLFKFIKPNLIAFDSKYAEFWEKFGVITKEGGVCMPNNEEEFFGKLTEEVKKGK